MVATRFHQATSQVAARTTQDFRALLPRCSRRIIRTSCIRRFGYLTGFAEKYRLGELLGAGSFGTVHVGIQNGTGERFAVKTIPKRYMGDQLEPVLVRRVQHEVDIYTLLGSSLNIAPLYEVYEDDNCVDLVMQLCSGGELWQRLRKGAYSEQDAARLAREVLMTVAQCHAKNVIIRDVKAENFLFLDGSEGSPLKMIDFGLADFCAPEQELSNRVGSPVYVAPEVLKMKYGRTADLWSAGILTYQLLTGHLPFQGEFSMPVDELFKSRDSFSLKDLFRAILYADLDFDCSPWQDISPEAKALVQGLLTRDPTKRLTAEQALQHPWFTNLDNAGSTVLDPSVVQCLQRFGTYSKLKQAALKQLALLVTKDYGSGVQVAPGSRHWLAALNEKDTQAALSAMEAMPAKNGDSHVPYRSSPDGLAADGSTPASNRSTQPNGSAARPIGSTIMSNGPSLRSNRSTYGSTGHMRLVPYEQVVHQLQLEGFELSQSEIRQLLGQFKLSKAGMLDYYDLVAALLEWRNVRSSPEWGAWVAKVFKSFDADGTGELEPSDLTQLLCGEICPVEDTVPALLRSFHKPGTTGSISFEEFSELLGQEAGDKLDLYESRAAAIADAGVHSGGGPVNQTGCRGAPAVGEDSRGDNAKCLGIGQDGANEGVLAECGGTAAQDSDVIPISLLGRQSTEVGVTVGVQGMQNIGMDDSNDRRDLHSSDEAGETVMVGCAGGVLEDCPGGAAREQEHTVSAGEE